MINHFAELYESPREGRGALEDMARPTQGSGRKPNHAAQSAFTPLRRLSRRHRAYPQEPKFDNASFLLVAAFCRPHPHTRAPQDGSRAHTLGSSPAAIPAQF